MSLINEFLAATTLNFRNLRLRPATSAVVVIGMASVVAVTTCVLAMAASVTRTNGNTAAADRVLVLSGGARSELGSRLSKQAVLSIAEAPQLKRSTTGKPLVSGEAVVLVDVPRGNQSNAKLSLRGIGLDAMTLRPELRLSEGRMFRPGLTELIIGRAAQQEFGIAIGSQLTFGRGQWTVVGAFESNRDRHESELLSDVDTVLTAFRETNVQSATAVLTSAAQFDAFKATLTANPTLTVEVRREAEYYAAQSAALSSTLRVLGYAIGMIMGIGALCGALNIMYTTVSGRSVEIATLQAIGFGRGAIIGSVLTEALALALAGGVIGVALAWTFFHGTLMSTSAGLTQLVFQLTLDRALIVQSLLWTAAVGLFGGLLPALRAARVPLSQALRAA